MTEAERISLEQKCPETFTEPFTGELYDRHYGAVPANPYYNDGVKVRQNKIKEEFATLFEYPPEELGIPESFKQMFIDDYYINVERRRMINYENFARWRMDNPQLEDEELEGAVQRTEMGYAESGDVLDVALNTELSGLEIGRVSHPYWRRTEFITPMRLDVSAAIIDRGGELTPIQEPYRRVKIVPHLERNEQTQEDEIIGFIVRYKRDVGSIPKDDGTVLRVVERQVAAYRADEASGFDQSIIEEMHEYARKKKDFRWDKIADERFPNALLNTLCDGYINKIIQTDTAAPFVVPESTTIYCYSEKGPGPEEKINAALSRLAFRAPDSDNGIAFYQSSAK